MEDIKYMVRVSCMTFNHAHYIADAMNGFCMQETNFPFVCTIMDDASTDGEQDVIKNYLEEHFDLEDSSVVRKEETDDYFLTFAQHKTNKNCYFAVLFLKYNHYSIKKPKMPYIEEWCDTKYVALCEGDDYWIDSQKLQTQTDLLDANPDISLVAGGYVYKKGSRETLVIKNENNNKNFRFNQNDWKKNWYTKTLTVMYRVKATVDYQKKKTAFKYNRDVHLFYYLLKWGDGIYVPKLFGEYNVHAGGICSSNSKEKNAIIAYNCHKELYEEEGGEVLRYLLLDNIFLCLRLKRMDKFSLSLLKEGNDLAINWKEKLKLLSCFSRGLLNFLYHRNMK